MAEEILKPELGKGKTARKAKRLSTKIDLTPMVDLGFLLITFFILTTTWSKPKQVLLLLPAGETPDMLTGESTALTFIPLEGEKVFYYNGELNKAIAKNAYGVINNNGMRNLIIQKQLALDANPKYTRNDLSLIIKPTGEATYKNIVSVLDEVLINQLKHYSFVDISEGEKLWLQSKAVMK